MFRVGEDVNPDAFRGVLEELARKTIPVNKYRINSGEGRSQCFGLVRQRNGTYTGSRLNFERPELYQELLALGNRILPPEFKYTSIQLNVDYQTEPHFDKGNKNESAIVAFGEFEEGELVINDVVVPIKNRLVYFDGSLWLHWTRPFKGYRVSVVFFTVIKDFLEVPTFSFVINEKGRLNLREDIGGVSRIYDTSGKIMFSSDGRIPARRPCIPTLRPCVENREQE